METYEIVIEWIAELTMQALLGYLAYAFWRGYRQSANRALLFLTSAFIFLFSLHLASQILEFVFGYEFPHVFEPHHIILLLTLAALAYVLSGGQWRGTKIRLPSSARREPPPR